jgi:dephospho-CoA kinase
MNIGIIGKFGSGKTTASNYIIEEYGYKRFSLAEPIKWIMKEFLYIENKTDPRYRKTVQTIGTDWFRSIDDLVWVKYLMKRVNRSKCRAVVDDVRFVNEADTLLEDGWLLIYLDCPDDVRRRRCIERDGTFDENTLKHPSETGVDEIIEKFGSDFNLVRIDASGTMEDTAGEIDLVLAKFNIHKKSWLYKTWKKGELWKWLSQIGPKGSNTTKAI